MIRIPVNRPYKYSIALPTAIEGDTLTYTIYKQSDGSTFASGSPTYNVGIFWDITFTPTTLSEKYLLEVLDVSGDRVGKEEFEAVGRTVEVPSEEALDTTAAGMLTAVNTAIAQILAGGAVQSYSIAGRNVQKMTLTELYDIRDRLQQEVNRAIGPARNYASF